MNRSANRAGGAGRAAAAGLAWCLVACLAAAAQGRQAIEPRLAAAGLRGVTRDGSPARAVFTNRWNRIEFEAGSRRATVNGVLVYLNDSVIRDKGQWTAATPDWFEGLGFRWAPRPAPRRKSELVLLDPGHGGADKGAISARRVEEKRVTLDVAKRVAKILEARGVTVRYTRDRDMDLSLAARVAIAERLKPDAFVSLHVNAAPSNRAVKGVETFVMAAPGYAVTAGGAADKRAYPGNRAGALNMALGFEIQSALIRYVGAEDRGVKRARFYVIKYTSAPSVLVELGFLSNADEEAALISRAHRDKLAEGVARGILSYLATARKP